MHERRSNLDRAAREIDWEIESDCLQEALRILRDPACSLATASYLFWAVNPQDFLTRELSKAGPGNETATQWTVVREVVLGVRKGRFRNGIVYDPGKEWRTSAEQPPAVLLRPSKGETPILWRERTEVRSWWPDQLEIEIHGAVDAEDLFGIAVFLDHPDQLRLVLESPRLDAGTGLLTYWRLWRAATLWVAAEPLLEQAQTILLAGQLPAVVRYDPTTDPENGNLAQPPKWDIPDELLHPTT